MTKNYANYIDISNECFLNNANIISVDCQNIPWMNNSMVNAFRACYNLKSISGLNNNVTNLAFAFVADSQLNYISHLPQNTTNLYYTFSFCTGLSNFPTIPNSVTDMSSTFYTCSRIVTPPIIPNSVTNLSQTFITCINLETPPIIPNSVTNMYSTFMGCHALTTIPNIPNSVTQISYAFQQCPNISTININSSNIIYASGICYNSSGLQEAELNLPNVISIDRSFENCLNLTTANINVPNCTDVYNLFYGCTKLNTVNLYATKTYNAANLFYNCKSLTNITLNINNCTNAFQMFSYCENLVTAPELPDTITGLAGGFDFCYKLETVPTIPNSVNNLNDTFFDCICLVNVPNLENIPNSCSLHHTFCNCRSLINQPTINPATTYLARTFDNCISLQTINIPANVRELYGTYQNCSNITSIPNIPQTVTNIANCFYGCTNIKDNIFIKSANITNATNCFYDTSLIKNVYIPFEYENGVNTQTYNSFIAAGYGTNSYLHGVHLKDIEGSKIRINATPNDATVLMYNETFGSEVDEDALNKFTYTNTNNDILINGLNTADTNIIVPTLWAETNNMRAIDGSTVRYKVYKEGYDTVENNIEVDGSETINVNLEQTMCTYNVTTMPKDATVTLTTSATTTYYAWYENDDGNCWYTLTETPVANDQLFDYYASDNTMHPAIPWGESIVSYDDSTTPPRLRIWTLGDSYWAQRDTTKDKTSVYVQNDNSITVPYGTEVSYTVSKNHYGTITGTEVLTTSIDKFIQLPIDQHTFTINPTPSDAGVQILIENKLRNQQENDWIIAADNYNGDILLQEYIGSSTDVVMPTTFTTNNTITADYGSIIEWKVGKDGYADKTGTITLTQNTEINVDLGNSVNIDGYNYTINNGVLTLTKYTGNGGDIDAPLIEEEE